MIQEEYRVMYVTDRNDLLEKDCWVLHWNVRIAMIINMILSHKKIITSFLLFSNNVREVGIESVIGRPETYAKKPLMEVSNDDVKNILTFINKPDTNRLIVSVMGDLDTIRKTYILTRGVYDAHGEEVEPGTPKSILPFNPAYPKNRLGLAEWLFDEKIR